MKTITFLSVFSTCALVGFCVMNGRAQHQPASPAAQTEKKPAGSAPAAPVTPTQSTVGPTTPATSQLAQTAQSAQPAQLAQPATPKKLDRAALEAELSRSLENVVLEGTWQMVRGGADATLSPPRPDKYTIESANKADGDWWVFKARIQFDEHDVTLPVRVRVVWAEDTPIVTVDDTPFPGIGTYSARVMFYRGYYTGTWFGTGYGGIMSGRIVKASENANGGK